jgi:ABC-type phosphate/phosphonate transport system substrate-binding protein
MVRLGGAASPTYISVFRGLQAHFRRHGIELDWLLYSDYDALVEAFVKREIDLAWNAPLAYVKITTDRLSSQIIPPPLLATTLFSIRMVRGGR